MAYFYRTKQPTKETSWSLASLVIFVLRNTPPPPKCVVVVFNLKSNANLPTNASWEVWEVLQRFGGFSIVHVLTVSFLLVSRPWFSATRAWFGSSKPEGNKQGKSCFLLSLEVFVLGANTGCTTLIALPCDTVLRSTSSPSSGKNVYCLWCYSSPSRFLT